MKIKKFMALLVAVAMAVTMGTVVSGETAWGWGSSIDLSNQGITDERLAEMVASGEIPRNVTRLILANNQISDISPISTLTSLQLLFLGRNQISDISLLSSLENLSGLYLWENQISDLTPLKGMHINTLSLSNNQIVDISPLSEVERLSFLYIGGNQITDISPITGLTNLRTLELQSNQITDLTPLTNLPNVEWLFLSENPINNLTPLKKMTQLRCLDIHCIPVNISQLEELKAALPDCEVVYNWCGRCETLSCECLPPVPNNELTGYRFFCAICVVQIPCSLSHCGECVNLLCEDCVCNCRESNPDTSVTFAILPAIIAGGIAAICRPRRKQ
jgi:hypothetical protein